MRHTCHARGCETAVPPRLLMCKRHWQMVPLCLQRLIWKHYRPGQEIDKHPTEEYLRAQRLAVDAVAEREDAARFGTHQGNLAL